MERTRRPHIPSFGDWNYTNEFPVTQYFESAMPTGVVRSSHCSEEEEGPKHCAFYLASPVKPIHRQRRPKERRSGGMRQRSNYRVAIKPVDEDLYKIPPELIKKPRRSFLRSFFTGCLGLNCVA